jgi:hypothetical protein
MLLDKRVELKGPDGGQFAVLFANWPGTEEGILDFTRKYGPIIPPKNEEIKNFGFSLDAWCENQRALMASWIEWKPGAIKGTGQLRYYTYGEPPGPALKTYDLRGFIWLSFQTSPLYLHRRCTRPDCRKFFIASRPQEHYCTKDCRRWAELRAKQIWWNKNRKKKRGQAKKPRLTGREDAEKG